MRNASLTFRFILLLATSVACMVTAWWTFITLFSAPATSGPVLHPLMLVSPSGNKTTMQVEWATTPSQRETGLMNRSVVKNGMLFIFDTADTLEFWMKNTLVPLDIVFFNDKGMYVSSTTMVPCTGDPCQLYSSESPAKYALEMPSRFLSGINMTSGWKMVQ